VLLGLAVGSPDVACADEPAGRQLGGGMARPSSGFWGTGQERGPGAYRWKLLGVGVVMAAGVGYGLLRLVRRVNAEREAELRSRSRR
jgi:hypothetical protein